MRLISDTPILTHTDRFPRLIEGLEEKHVYAPIQNPANTFLPERRRRTSARHRLLVVVPGRGPSRLADPQLRRFIRSARYGLDVPERLHDVVEETARGIGESLALPVREGVGEEDIGATFCDQRVCSSVLEFVPGVGSADFVFAAGLGAHVLDFGEELRSSQVPAVEGFGSDCYGVYLIRVLGGVFHDGGGVAVVGCVVFVVCYPVGRSC